MKSPHLKPCLWFDQQAEEAVNFYTSVFKKGEIGAISRNINDDIIPKDSVLTISFSLSGQEFIALNGGPLFNFTPAISFFVGCENTEELDRLWEKLSEDGSVLMEAAPLPPFFEKFGWLQDKYGLSWQLGTCGIPQYISPYLLFVGKQCGRAEEAIQFYGSIFNTSKTGSIVRHEKSEYDIEGSIQFGSFSLNEQEFMIADSGWEHAFSFTEAISFCIYCQTQTEIDHYWEALSDGGEKSQCGWLKDKFGISWQVIPSCLEKMMTDENPEKVKRISEALFKMTKLDIELLQKAYDNN